MKPDMPYAALALLAALAACDSGARQDGKATAGGEVLEGSVSDAMVPVDRVRSQPPLAEKGESGDTPGKKSARKANASGSAAAEASSDEAVPVSEAPAAGSGNDTPAETTQGAE